MLKIFNAMVKELLLLRRDRSGLLILFLMPALLVVIITLVQENVMKLTGQKKTEVVLLDLDHGILGKSLRKQLEADQIDIVLLTEDQTNRESIAAAVSSGEYQAGIVIEKNTSAGFGERLDRLFAAPDRIEKVEEQLTPITLYFDPGVLPGFRRGLQAQVNGTLQRIELLEKIKNIGGKLEEQLQPLEGMMDISAFSAETFAEVMEKEILTLNEYPSGEDATKTKPYNPVQQNVPAWTIFGMFFTALPVAGSILQERKSGIWLRLSSLPVTPLHLYSGKVLAYSLVCCAQFFLITLIGTFIFPLIGLEAFSITEGFFSIICIILFLSLAVCGFGILLGLLCNSLNQATMAGACFVVAAAAIGGVMVPVYAMPEIMQKISIISPLNWGLSAFQEILLRGNSLSSISRELLCLFVFFLVSLIFAWKLSRSRI